MHTGYDVEWPNTSGRPPLSSAVNTVWIVWVVVRNTLRGNDLDLDMYLFRGAAHSGALLRRSGVPPQAVAARAPSGQGGALHGRAALQRQGLKLRTVILYCPFA